MSTTTLAQLQRRLATKINTKTCKDGYVLEWKDQVRRITCGDGVSLSVQASDTHYSTPRLVRGPWSEVEVGFPQGVHAMPDSWNEYAERNDVPVSDIYAYIPIELVAQFIDEHGGIKD